MRHEKNGFWLTVLAAFTYPVGGLLGRAQYPGIERIPAGGGALVVANHLSHVDPLYTGMLVHRAGRRPRFLAKHSLWRIPVLGRALTGSGMIPVYRDSADAQQSLRDGIAALDGGKIVVIYPEGTITRDPDGWPMASRTGVARLALASDVPVLPVVHWGTREVADLYRKRFRPLPRKDIVVRCGEPVDLSAYRGREIDGELLREVTDLLMTRVRDLLADVRHEPAPSTFFRRAS